MRIVQFESLLISLFLFTENAALKFHRIILKHFVPTLPILFGAYSEAQVRILLTNVSPADDGDDSLWLIPGTSPRKAVLVWIESIDRSPISFHGAHADRFLRPRQSISLHRPQHVRYCSQLKSSTTIRRRGKNYIRKRDESLAACFISSYRHAIGPVISRYLPKQ